MEHIERLLEPAWSADLAGRGSDDLRAMRDEVHDVETTLSYYRRLAQGRIEIMEAWGERRRAGGSVEDLVADLPRILGGSTVRAAAPDTRFAEADPAIRDLRWPDRREELVSDEALANLPLLDDDALAEQLETLRTFERELSDERRRLHGVLDALEHELAARQAAEAADR